MTHFSSAYVGLVFLWYYWKILQYQMRLAVLKFVQTNWNGDPLEGWRRATAKLKRRFQFAKLPYWITSLRQDWKNTEALWRTAREMRLVMLNGVEGMANGSWRSSKLMSDPEWELGETHILILDRKIQNIPIHMNINCLRHTNKQLSGSAQGGIVLVKPCLCKPPEDEARWNIKPQAAHDPTFQVLIETWAILQTL